MISPALFYNFAETFQGEEGLYVLMAAGVKLGDQCDNSFKRPIFNINDLDGIQKLLDENGKPSAKVMFDKRDLSGHVLYDNHHNTFGPSAYTGKDWICLLNSRALFREFVLFQYS